MGTYTSNYNFYKAAPVGEFVDVESQVNGNFRKVNDMLRPLAEYYFTDVISVVENFPVNEGYKYYKHYSNSIWSYRPSAATVGLFQDANSDVDDWTTSGLTFYSGYGEVDDETRIGYKLESTGDTVHWRGFIYADGKANITRNNHISIVHMPPEITPDNSRYFYVPGGNSSSGVTFRVMFQPDGDIEIIRYGPATIDDPNERFINLSDIWYPISDGNVA